jgi:PAS domain S-box-containing protein
MDWPEAKLKVADPASTAEAARIDVLHNMGVLDSGADPRFDRIARLAARVFDTPRAAVLLVDADRLWLKAKVGVSGDEFPRRGSLAEVSLRQGEAIFVADVRQTKDMADAAQAALLATHYTTRFYASAPIRAADGKIIGAVNVSDDQPHEPPDAGQRTALLDLAALASEELIRDSEQVASRRLHAFDAERLKLALNAAHLGAYEWSRREKTILLSERLRALVGVSAEWVASARFREILLPEDSDRVVAEIKTALATNGRYEIEHRIKRLGDGAVLWVSSAGFLIKQGDDDEGRVIGVVQDITPRKMADEQRETLVAELDHRVKNVLSAVHSMAAQSARKATSLDSFLKTFSGRLKSMASAHQLLTATRWRGAGMLNIATAELGGIAPGQTRWEGPDLLLAPRAANAMSLALHELATNAVKFGALSVDTGKVDVRWRADGAGGLELRWTETGGPPVSPPTRRGFGATLLDKVTGRELEGSVSVEHRREGLNALIKAGPAAMATTEIPPAQVEQAQAAPPPSPVPVAHEGPPARIDGLRLLIVEDALLLALELEAGLQEAGAVMAGSAADVDEALGMLDRPIDAAVLDANLNGASVLPVAQALALRGIPFVFATGYGDNRFNPEGFDAPVIRKPYDVTQVTAALAAITGRA